MALDRNSPGVGPTNNGGSRAHPLPLVHCGNRVLASAELPERVGSCATGCISFPTPIRPLLVCAVGICTRLEHTAQHPRALHEGGQPGRLHPCFPDTGKAGAMATDAAVIRST